MPKTAKSQWEFGELFPAAETRRTLTVSELTAQIKRLVEQQFGAVWVSGEISNLRLQPSGHLYFTLKDAASQLSCVLFRGEARGARDWLADGCSVLLGGGLSVYEPRGQYQLVVSTVEPQGQGALQLAFERLKRKLEAEGLFAPERKRPLPRYPRRIGVVTSPVGAAWRDVLHVVRRRDPGLELVLAGCRVQGEGAAQEIAAAIEGLNAYQARVADDPERRLDLILVTRGGGSLEDLWAFNEEVVARAISRSKLPVVSGVGHEIDFTISDFVADLRAATPSAAAELVTESVFGCRSVCAEAPYRLAQRARRRCAWERERLSQWRQRLVRAHPRHRLNESWQRLDDLQGSLRRSASRHVWQARDRWGDLETRWARLRPMLRVAAKREGMDRFRQQLGERARFHLRTLAQQLTSLRERLRLLSPSQVLARGYSLTTDEATGQILRSAQTVRPGQVLRTHLPDGQVRSVVREPGEVSAASST